MYLNLGFRPNLPLLPHIWTKSDRFTSKSILERCDFTVSYAQFGNKNKLTLYRLADFYTLFYFRYVENNRSRDDQYWQHHFMDRSVVSWEGFSFEEICLRHLPHIKQALGIAGIATEYSAWRFIPVKGNETKGT